MGIKTYGKLVRDKIPDIISRDNHVARWRRLNQAEFQAALKEKLMEEAAELAEAQSFEEILTEAADVLEVLRAAIKAHGITGAQVESMARNRAYERGAFVSQTLLLYTEPKPEPMPKGQRRRRAAS